MAKKQFKAESKRLLDMMINSIYTHKEIFLRELISNASDAIDKLAYLSLTDEKVGLSRSDFAIWLTVDKDARTLTIEDNGIGIAAKHLPHLFEQFYRVDESRGMGQGGTGLGLSIVKALCARYEASIDVQSEEGCGTRFILHFPSQPKEDA